MKLLKNRTTLGAICILLAMIICFVVTPFLNSASNKTIEILRVTKDIKAGDVIKEGMVKTIKVGAYNLPKDVLRKKETVIGNYAIADLVPGDYILSSKLSETPAEENSYLYNLNGEKQAVSVTIKNFADGLSGKLMSGDIVSVIAPDYKRMGSTEIPPELKYVKVIGVTASSGYDANTGEQTAEDKELPSTVTLLVTPEQSRLLAEIEEDGTMHLALVYRGKAEYAEQFIKVQDEALAKLYPKPTAAETQPVNSPVSDEQEVN
ncbi:MAG: Flp pilus assembly protein CpaB [Clostridia bacterium]|nr:Flp pilus assembly protein CpaB [Clostridia bacterium]